MILPMAALVLLTFIVAFTMLAARIRAVKSREVSLSYFKTYDASPRELPERMVLTQRCFNNLLEIPPLFYVACLAAMVIGMSGLLMLTLAWTYVALRAVQAFIHLNGNNVIWRMRSFLLGNLVLLAMWAILVVAQLGV
ncbi:MAPEG family protein [Gilvimarinus xylanilyticus]|uniref:MAPEG family protein n=1 Tax=Gilvimarinus xylanilyticus TaxID=2944139 RepID=A0A9X2HVQ0_9GAMM|nr:MAPEG family protein [Gilvimarinus xylanilyticus]MCP8899050.1 MAPEG family protein [Gilvimarinus xylanilyticus]